jgi:Fe-S-cluster containining protein
MTFIYPKNLAFSCILCGICCGDTKEKKRKILLLNEEAIWISNKIGKKILDFAIPCVDTSPYLYRILKKENGKCIFLSENNQCCIYQDRPLICRFYPFELFNRINESYEFLFTKECQGINQGKILDKKYFRDLFEMANNKFKRIKKSS